MGAMNCPVCGVEPARGEFAKHVIQGHDGLVGVPAAPSSRPYRLFVGASLLYVAGAALLIGTQGSTAVVPSSLGVLGLGLVTAGYLGGPVVLARDIRQFDGSVRGSGWMEKLALAAWFIPIWGGLAVVLGYTALRRRKTTTHGTFRQAIERASRQAERAIDAIDDGDYGTAADRVEAALEPLNGVTVPDSQHQRVGRARTRCSSLADQCRELAAADGSPEPNVDTVADLPDDDAVTADDETDPTEEMYTTAPATDGAPSTAAGPPDGIPSTPDVEVDYDAIEHHERIGSGGQATVTRATVDGIEIAVKEPAPDRTLRIEEAERFVAEAETWAKLDDHEGVVTVLGWGTRPHPWLAMEYMGGGHVGARSFGVEQAVWTAYRTAGAVREAHRKGVAHLDLKPANVLLRRTDRWPVPKVADWGLARHLLEEGSVEGLSPPYAAPEQFDEHRGKPDNLTDVYALGALTYELVTGWPPFEGSVGEIREQVLDPAVTPVPPSERRADVPPALDGVVERALATDRDDRYEDVLLFRNDLHEVYTGLRD